MIPKIIHYCWFGGNPLPELAQKCIASWKKYCPDYEIKEWNEGNFDLSCCDYVREAYEAKKWAFVSDVARLYAMVTEGGIYMDTDVEVIQPLDGLLCYHAVSGFETDKNIPTGLMACEKGNPMFQELLDEYETAHFILPDGTVDKTTNVERITNACLKYGFIPNNKKQTINTFTLLPKDYLCPKNNKTGELKISDNTLAIHHFDGSWLSSEEHYKNELTRKVHKKLPMIPVDLVSMVCAFTAATKFNGIKAAFSKLGVWIKKKSVRCWRNRL
ncbi:glycosyltransferase family 32 protein [Faecalibacterium prausnitzii]|jgi:polysaccharide biosynthesis protein cpsM(V)|uniref:glycosyltransferase family 32 protein n=1 Tax=Faecalibacterium prausnitzii TaxID=853 RepID=UPI003AAF87C5